jgi:hypothetical protein
MTKETEMRKVASLGSITKGKRLAFGSAVRGGLAVLAVATLGLSLSGCGGGGGGGGTCAAGTIQVTWGFASGGDCVPGDVVTVRLDNDNTQLVDIPCDQFGGVISPVVAGPHTIDLTLFDAGGNVVSPPVPDPANISVPCGGTLPVDYTFPL